MAQCGSRVTWYHIAIHRYQQHSVFMALHSIVLNHNMTCFVTALKNILLLLSIMLYVYQSTISINLVMSCRDALTVSSRTKQAAKAKATKVAIQTMPIAIPKAGTKKRAAAQRKNGYLRIFATKSQNPSKSMNKHTVFDGSFEVGPTASNISNKLRLNPAYWKTTRFLLDRFEWRFKPCSLNSSF